MTRFLADTSAWTRSARLGERWEHVLGSRDVALCSPVVLESLYSARSPAEYVDLAGRLRGFRRLPITARVEQAATRAQALPAERSRHRAPRPVDLLIAAVAETHDVTLLHYDRHFDLIAEATGQRAAWVAPRGSLG